ncbi:hypothetical protein ACLB2K_041754 [Fragaria x ananassa]
MGQLLLDMPKCFYLLRPEPGRGREAERSRILWAFHSEPAQVTASRGRDWDDPVFDSPMLRARQGYLDRVIIPYSRLSQVFWLCTNKFLSPQSERVLGWGVILEMPRIGFTRVWEAWCRVPKSPRESRERCGPLRGESVRAWLGRLAIERCGRCVASQSALGCGDSLLSVAAAAWRVSPRLVGTVAIERCGRCVASQSALGWGLLLLSVAAAAWRVCPSLVGETCY